MRHGSDALAPPPRRLSIGGDTNGAGNVRGIAIAGLHQPVIVSRGKEHDFLGTCCFHDESRVGTHASTPRQHADIQRFEMCERIVRPFDRQHSFPGRGLVSIEQRVHHEIVPGMRAELENRDRFVDPPQERVRLGEDLHEHLGSMTIGEQDFAGPDEVFVRVVARLHLVHRQVKNRRIEPLPAGHVSR